MFLLTETTMVSKTYGNIVRFIYKTIVVSNNEFGITTRVIEERIHVRDFSKICRQIDAHKIIFCRRIVHNFCTRIIIFCYFGTSIAEIFTAVLVFKKRRNHNNNKLGYSSQLNRGNYFIVIRTKYFHNVVFVTMLVLLTMTKKPKGVVDDNKKPFNFYKV